MLWAQLLAYVTGTVDQELLLRNEYLAAENRILKAQIKGRLLLSEEEKATLAEIARLIYHRRALRNELLLRALTGTSFFTIRHRYSRCRLRASSLALDQDQVEAGERL